MEPRLSLCYLKETCSYISALTRLITFSIVAIHGVGGDRINTWCKGDTLWLRDLLPEYLSDFSLRISSFGYNSTIFGRSSSSQIRDCAERLLKELYMNRGDVRGSLPHGACYTDSARPTPPGSPLSLCAIR